MASGLASPAAILIVLLLGFDYDRLLFGRGGRSLCLTGKSDEQHRRDHGCLPPCISASLPRKSIKASRNDRNGSKAVIRLVVGRRDAGRRGVGR